MGLHCVKTYRYTYPMKRQIYVERIGITLVITAEGLVERMVTKLLFTNFVRYLSGYQFIQGVSGGDMVALW